MFNMSTHKSSIRTGTSSGKSTHGSLPKSKKVRGAYQDHQSFLSATIHDMKSQLPNYDEVSQFASNYGRETSKATSVSMPKPGRSIKKLNMEDLPMNYSNPSILLPERLKTKTPGSRGKLDDYNLISKFDAAVFTPDSRLTQETAAKLKTDFKQRRGSKSTLGKADNKNSNFLSLSSNIIGGIESDLGFGFRSNLETGALGRHKGLLRDDRVPSPQLSTKVASKKTETSIQALKKKINSKKEQWNNEKFGWDEYHYQEPESIALKQRLGSSNNKNVMGEKTPPNEKLAEMAQTFRTSLNVNLDMRKAIKTPKSSLVKSADTERPPSNGSSESAGSQSEECDNPCKTVPVGQINALLKQDKSIGRSTSSKSHGTGTTKAKRKKSKKELSGVMNLQTLLELNSPKLQDSNANSIDEEDPDALRRPFDFTNLKQVTSSLATSGSKSRVSKAEIPVQTSPRSTEVIMAENFYEPGVKTKKSKDKLEAQDLIRQRLGESVKNVDDAATIAGRLGSLMTRVAMCKKVEGNNPVRLDTVSLARELRELASSMEKDYGIMGVASQTSGSVEVQTDVKSVPPKFTKQMSYTDQLVLRKLREVRQMWTQDVEDAKSLDST